MGLMNFVAPSALMRRIAGKILAYPRGVVYPKLTTDLHRKQIPNTPKTQAIVARRLRVDEFQYRLNITGRMIRQLEKHTGLPDYHIIETLKSIAADPRSDLVLITNIDYQNHRRRDPIKNRIFDAIVKREKLEPLFGPFSFIDVLEGQNVVACDAPEYVDLVK